jgi:type II secretory ATPase GspE/PulE/Tfp pilus assembly ATPase PilB-like protein
VAEILLVSSKIKKLIAEGRDPLDILSAAREEGFVSLREAARQRVLEGITTVEELKRVLD